MSVSVLNSWPCAWSSLLQIEVVLDDAVVHDDDAAGAVAVRMRVLLGRPAVRRPARVADAVETVDRIDADRLSRGSPACRADRRSEIPSGLTTATPAES